MNKQRMMSQEKLEAAFNAFDQDGNGMITAIELKQMLSEKGSTVSDDVWAGIIKEVDQNGDGMVPLLALPCNAA